MIIKDFTKSLKKLKKSDIDLFLAEEQYVLIEEYVKNIHNQKYQENAAHMYQVFMSAKVVKGFEKYVKNFKDELSEGWAVLIMDALEYSRDHKENIQEDELDAILEGYTAILGKLLKKRTKEITKKSNITPEALQELLVIAPSTDFISNEKYVGVYVRKMTSKLYTLCKKADPKSIGLESVKDVSKLFKGIFNKDLLRWVALEILLERKDAVAKATATEKLMWALLTDFALETVENLPKEDRKKTVENYCKRRFGDAKRDKDSARRVNLLSLSEDDFPKTSKLVKKLSEDERVKQYL